MSIFRILTTVVLASSPSWEPVLTRLNQPRPVVSRETPLATDLPRRYAEELAAIKTRWEKAGPKSPLPRATAREKRNEFYHSALRAANDAVAARLARGPRGVSNHRAAAARVLEQIAGNAVADTGRVPEYDATGEIGFCFGRALLAHFLLLEAGVPQADIAKIFVLGELEVAGQIWNFHTAVMVRDPQEGWLVVDPLAPKLLPYREWMTLNAARDLKGRLSRARFYVTDPRKFLPAYGAYATAQLEDPALRRYFTALRATLRP